MRNNLKTCFKVPQSNVRHQNYSLLYKPIVFTILEHIQDAD